VWIPYPHQNLGVAWDQIEEPEALVTAVSTLLGGGRPFLPHGLGAVPPARELLVQWDEERTWLGVWLYPSVAIVGRLAGRLGHNAWLAGGTVDAAGRPATVTWDEGIWQLAVGVGDAPRSRAPASDEPVLGAVVLQRPLGEWPEGLYAVRREPDGLTLRRGDRPPDVAAGSGDEVAITVDRSTPGGRERLWLFRGDPSPGGIELPRMAAWASDGDPRRLLPAGQVLSLVGDLPSAIVAGGELVATDRNSLAASRARLDAAGEEPGVIAPRLRVRVVVASASAVLEDLLTVWKALPIGGGRRLERWMAARDLLRAVSDFEDVMVWIESDGRAGAAVLVDRSGGNR